MRHRRLLLFSAATLAVGVLAACSSSKSSSSATTAAPATSSAPGSSSPTTGAASGTPGAFAKAHYTTSLSGICPNPLVVQSDWLPEADHGYLWQLIGGGGTQSQYEYMGPLGSTGINLEILAGGPGLGNGVSQPSSVYAGNLVKRVTPDLTFESTDDAIQYSKQFPTTQVFANYEKSPQIILFDPSKYHITTLDDLKAATSGGAKIYVTSATFSYVRWLIGQGVPSSAFIGGYQGDLEKFVGGGGSVLNQGYSTNEVWTLEHNTQAWNKPVGYVYVADLGFKFYQSALTVATSRLQTLTPCLQKLIPLMQHALVDYAHNPFEVNTVIADFNNKGLGATFWHTPEDLNAAATHVMVTDKLVIPASGAVGTFDNATLQGLINELVPIFKSAGTASLNPNVTPDNIATNQFLDTSITYTS
jgi:hypothetical protein